MKAAIFFSLALILATAILRAQMPTIPEEARRQFVIATTLFKDAKTADAFVQVVNHFKQAAYLAPQWPEARYNLAMAREAAGDFAGAVVDLRTYLLFKLTADEARTVTDHIYALEAKAEQAGQKIPAAPAATTPTATSPAAPTIESYQCATSENLKTLHQNFIFDFSSHTATETIQYENASQHFRNLKFEESGSQVTLREGCNWPTKALGCATVNRKTLKLSIYAWGPRGGEDAPSGDRSGGNTVVVYDCFLLK
jgi:hypothetical protein